MVQDFRTDLRFQSLAIAALQEAAESYLTVHLFEVNVVHLFEVNISILRHRAACLTFFIELET